jgi:hypothetical protein
MTADLDRFLGVPAGCQTLRAKTPMRRATDRDPFVLAATEAARRTLGDAVDEAFTWPELVALELLHQEERDKRQRRALLNVEHRGRR